MRTLRHLLLPSPGSGVFSRRYCPPLHTADPGQAEYACHPDTPPAVDGLRLSQGSSTNHLIATLLSTTTRSIIIVPGLPGDLLYCLETHHKLRRGAHGVHRSGLLPLDGGADILTGLPALKQLGNTAEAVSMSSLLQTEIEGIRNRDSSTHGNAPDPQRPNKYILQPAAYEARLYLHWITHAHRNQRGAYHRYGSPGPCVECPCLEWLRRATHGTSPP